LTPDTVYEFRAKAINGATQPYFVYGDISTFGTSHSAGGATPTPGGINIPGLPGLNLSSSVKVFLALLVTVLSMALLGYLLRSAPTVAVVCALAAGLMWVIAFASWGWLPGWVILAIVVILGMLILLLVLAKR
jgi:hypothetical protein